MKDKNSILAILGIVVICLLAIAGIGFAIYVYVTYGGKPLDELPAWTLPFFLKK